MRYDKPTAGFLATRWDDLARKEETKFTNYVVGYEIKEHSDMMSGPRDPGTPDFVLPLLFTCGAGQITGSTLAHYQSGMTGYALSLNRTRLLYLEAQPRKSANTKSSNFSDPIGTVVQVTIKSRNSRVASSPSKGELAIFAIEQDDITVNVYTAIETLLIRHVNGSEKFPKRVIIQEDLLRYTLVGERQKWTYGQWKQFYWGRHPLRSGEDKWVFYFETMKS
ncbi:hypothetical protein BDR05DRAFT_987992 [Suillus weaverae]|nr:hypothetical protein BDR05DRAFT_987992 [Suillus weaverae]